MPGPKTGAQRAKLPKHLRAEKRFAPTDAEAMARYEVKIRRRSERKQKKARRK